MGPCSSADAGGDQTLNRGEVAYGRSSFVCNPGVIAIDKTVSPCISRDPACASIRTVVRSVCASLRCLQSR
jgi:hypothetical protein